MSPFESSFLHMLWNQYLFHFVSSAPNANPRAQILPWGYGGITHGNGWVFVFLLLAFLMWRTKRLLQAFANRPVRTSGTRDVRSFPDVLSFKKSNLRIMGYSPIYGTWLSKIHYIMSAPAIILKSYEKVSKSHHGKLLA